MKASPGKAQNLFERQIISEGQQKSYGASVSAGDAVRNSPVAVKAILRADRWSKKYNSIEDNIFQQNHI